MKSGQFTRNGITKWAELGFFLNPGFFLNTVRSAGFWTFLAAILSCWSAERATAFQTEQYIPADQLDVLFQRDRKGVLLSREEFRKLVSVAEQNAAEQQQQPPAKQKRVKILVVSATACLERVSYVLAAEGRTRRPQLNS